MAITLRRAELGDIPQILSLIRELAEYERDPDAAKATPEQMRRALFGDASREGPGAGVAECLMGEVEGVVQGLALFYTNFSTWTGKPGLYLEDLFVRPAARGQGLGKVLLTEVARLAVERGYARVEWSVIDWNEPAIGFYKKLGAVAMDKWTVHRLSGEALERLGSTAE